VRLHGLLEGRHHGSEDRWETMRALSSPPFCSCDSRWVSLWYVSAGLRYTTGRRVSLVYLSAVYRYMTHYKLFSK
jgi:hypothetical protein